MRVVAADRLLYGSLPTRNRGYELLGRSSGCTPAQTEQAIAACRRYGQPLGAAASRPAWFALPLPAGPWAVVRVLPQGTDDQGRPGALLFDVALVPAAGMALSGYDIAAFVSRDLMVEPRDSLPTELPPLQFLSERRLPSGRGARNQDGAGSDATRIRAIVAAIGQRRRVALETEGPIDDLALAVWAELPERVRRRSSVATWAFGAENRFDLMAVPRLAGVALDPSYLSPEALLVPAPVKAATTRPTIGARLGFGSARPTSARSASAPGSLAVGLGGLTLVGVAALFWASTIRDRNRLLPPDPATSVADQPGPSERNDLAPAARERVLRNLQDLAGHFRSFDLGDPDDPGAFLSRLADALHYQGPLLSEAELARLRAAEAGGLDAARALRWHEQIQAFRDDQPWPGRFADLALPEQLRAVARSFHLDPEIAPEAVPEALTTRLARSEAVAPSPLGADFPALAAYARFLARLPRRNEATESGRPAR